MLLMGTHMPYRYSGGPNENHPVPNKAEREDIGIFKREKERSNVLQPSIYHFLLSSINIIYYHAMPLPNIKKQIHFLL